jgi:Arc/MetJ-type ribon-helix-helix transcriptional regulator
MAKNTSVQLQEDHLDGLQEMVDAGQADNRSEALRMAMQSGFREYGVVSYTETETRLRETARQLGVGFAMVGAVMLGLVYFGSVELRLLGIVPWIMALACYGVDRGLARVEPRVSLRLERILGGEKA